MLKFPEKLDFGQEIANIIESVFIWISNTFGFLFSFIKNSIDISVEIVTDLLTKIPFYIWIGVFIIYIVFHYIKKKKLGLLISLGVLILWLLVYNVYFKNPVHGYDQTIFETPWWIYGILIFFAGNYLYDYKAGIILTLLILLIGVLGVWDDMVLTLSIIIISVAISFILGLPLGILMAKSKTTEKIFTPILDLLQTIPTFVYLIPSVMFFGIGIVPGTIATIIYALAPLVRLTYLGIKEVDEEVVEAGKSFGSTSLQLLVKIELPQALPTIATGLNQTTMMAVAMVVTASMIGAGGLGAIVFDATQQNRIGQGFVGGFAIVFLAILLDRLLQGIAKKIETDRGVQV